MHPKSIDTVANYPATLRRIALAVDASDPDRAGLLPLDVLETYVDAALCESDESPTTAWIVRRTWELICLDDPTLA